MNGCAIAFAYVPVDYLDHHVKFAGPSRESFQPDGNLLWIGVRSNLAPLVAWVRSNLLPCPLDVVTNHEHPERLVSAADLALEKTCIPTQPVTHACGFVMHVPSDLSHPTVCPRSAGRLTNEPRGIVPSSICLAYPPLSRKPRNPSDFVQ